MISTNFLRLFRWSNFDRDRKHDQKPQNGGDCKENPLPYRERIHIPPWEVRRIIDPKGLEKGDMLVSRRVFQGNLGWWNIIPFDHAYTYIYIYGSINSHLFPVLGDKLINHHQPNSVGFYIPMIFKDSLLIHFFQVEWSSPIQGVKNFQVQKSTKRLTRVEFSCVW